ncbi:ATP-binding protein [Simiduia curdlanivorans]|uniref:histidine kinase n=1 Tax=Simiduia curdlanivorans TaxID=1492769 RepID=A0ABV8V5Z7_9GAMM|nr:ATP-binding protein [Simiduia curdlanivorans]MDN3638675.1 ATP-binding protein [Simiduia curdlanivorans]
MAIWLPLVGGLLIVCAYVWQRGILQAQAECAYLKASCSAPNTDDRAQAQRNAIASLAADADYASSDIQCVSRRLTKILSDVIQVERASIWLFSPSGDYFDCVALFDAGVAQDTTGVQLEVKSFPRYFDALRKDSRIYANDAVSDSRTNEFTDIYLKPLSISAMLDAGVVVDGQLVGAICLEHRHGIRQWQPDEEAFASLVATLVAQKLVAVEKFQALNDLALTNQRLQHVLDAASEISVIATDAQGIITLFNKGAENLLGYTADEMLFKQTPAIIHLESEVIEHGKELSAELGETIEGFEVFVAKARRGSYEEREWTYVRKDGSHVPVLLTVTAIRDEAGEMVGLLGVASDMTERRRHQLALEQHNRDLAIANEQAKQLIRDADRANEAKSEFLASMSHEIRTPMNGVLGMLHLIGRESLKPSQQHYLDLASSSARALLSVINDILDFSKIDAKKLTLEVLEFDLIALLSDIGKSMAIRAQENGVSLVLDLSDIQLEQVKGDPHRLRQVITNLLGNAVKFTEQGDILLRATLSQKDGRHWLSVSVIDSGVGVPEDKLSALFAPFFQADSSNTRRFGGTGLGLVISKQLVELMGGSIGAESKVGEGSHFFFTLPLEPMSAQSGVAEDETSSQVLLVDQSPPSRAVVLAELMLLGCRVSIADSIADAMSKYQCEKFSLLLVDESLCMDIDKLLTQKNLLIYILTNMGHQGDIPAYSAGYIHRPVSRNDLRQALGIDVAKKRILIAAGAEPTGERKLGRSARILLVEDNIINQQVALGLLADLGLTVTFAKDGIEALALVENSTLPFDLILMDCQMPRMDGFQATRKIRDLAPPIGQVPIIAMTANAMSGDREYCIAAGMNDYIAKPIEPDFLADRISYWLAQVVNKDEIQSSSAALGAQVNGQKAQFNHVSVPEAKVSMEVLKVWNFDAALGRVRGKPERLVMLISLFQQDMPARMTAIQSALHLCQFDEMAKLAHQVKGVAGNLSAELLAQTAAALEVNCNMEAISETAIAAMVSELDRRYERVIAEFERYVLSYEGEAE